MSIFADHIDIREYPLHDWESRRLSSKVSGKWTYFYDGARDRPMNGSTPYRSACSTITNPRSCTRMGMTVKTRGVGIIGEETRRPMRDSYDLARERCKTELEHQKLVIAPVVSEGAPIMQAQTRRILPTGGVRFSVPEKQMVSVVSMAQKMRDRETWRSERKKEAGVEERVIQCSFLREQF